jgi:hypothetical protein
MSSSNTNYVNGELVSPIADTFKTANQIAGYTLDADNNKILDSDIALPESTHLSVNSVTADYISVGPITINNTGSNGELDAPVISTKQIVSTDADFETTYGGINVNFDTDSGVHYIDIETGDSTKLSIGAPYELTDRKTIKAKANKFKVDGETELYYALNIGNPEAYAGYLNKSRVNGLYIYAITRPSSDVAHIYLTDDINTFRDSLTYTKEVNSTTGNTVYRFKFNNDLSKLDEAKIVNPFSDTYSSYSDIKSIADYRIFISIFSWNDKINKFYIDYNDYYNLDPTPNYLILHGNSVDIDDLEDAGLGTVSTAAASNYSWFRGLVIPSGYSNSGADTITNFLWDDPGVNFTLNSLVLGDDNFSGAINSIVTGESNKTFSRYNAVFGKENTNFGYCTTVVGRANTINSQNSFIAGSYNTVDAPQGNGCFIIGGQRYQENSLNAQNTVAVGFSNKINTAQSIAVGFSNKIYTAQSIAVGFGNNIPNTAKSSSVVLGRYANVKNDAALTLGCGWVSNLKNVLWCDESKVYFEDYPTVFNKNTEFKAATVFNATTSFNNTVAFNANTSFPNGASFGSNARSLTNFLGGAIFGSGNIDNSYVGNDYKGYGCLIAGNSNYIGQNHFGSETGTNTPTNYVTLLGSFLNNANTTYTVIVGLNNDRSRTTTGGYSFIVADGAQKSPTDTTFNAELDQHNAIEVKKNQGGININTKTNFNSDIYVKTSKGNPAKLVFTEDDAGNITISATKNF